MTTTEDCLCPDRYWRRRPEGCKHIQNLRHAYSLVEASKVGRQRPKTVEIAQDKALGQGVDIGQWQAVKDLEGWVKAHRLRRRAGRNTPWLDGKLDTLRYLENELPATA